MIKKLGVFKILFVFILVGTTLWSQKITQIKFVGLAHLSPTVAKEVADIRVGDEMDASKINESLKNFYSQGYFKDVWVDQQGGVLIYHFDEKVAIANIDVKGYGTGDEGDKLLQGMGLKKGDLYDKRRVKKAKRAIISQLESQGYYDTVVEVTSSPVGESSIALVFDVNKGEKITIRKQNFVGAEALDQSELEMELANKERDVLGWMPWRNSGEAAADQLEYDSYRVKNAYMEQGYLDAEVSKPLMRVDFGSYNAKVDYQVKEGVQYRLGTISITHKIDGLKNQDLKDTLLLKEGKIFNIKRMRRDIKRLEEEVGNFGFAYVKVAPQMNKDPEKKIINLNYVIQPGEPVTIKDVIISGNDVTKDRVIRRYLYLAPGDKFNATDLKDSKNALGRTGFFENVDIQSQRISEEEINLLVKVKEASTGTISAGGGYGSYEGLMVNASISDQNFFGTGINTTLGFEISKISKNGNLSFVNPRVWDSMYSLGVNFYKRDYEYIDYTQDQTGASMNVGREFLRHFYGSVGIGYVDNQSTVNDSFDSTLGVFYNDQYEKISGFASVKFDNTDDFYTPREGFIAALNLELAQMDGTMTQENIDRGFTEFDDFTKLNGRFGIFQGMEDWIDYDLILRGKVRFTKIFGNDEYIPIAERLFMGGTGSVRGYDPYSISPTVAGERIGGTERLSTSVEASIPLSQAAKMRLAFFYDYGIIGSDPVPTASGIDLEFDDISRQSTGVVLEWQSAFGPINLIFAYPIDEKAGDYTSVFEFTMGTKF
ncbi:outer membrane protein assembly factor BamA [Sulfurovum sp.]|uniref:outer membrane protein assembly factor BamA n=1 Tax=Sulfurovum sp. TaxID=1969726 RepID=UPI002867DF74|nr:outer membrane protein assembly factor BamA [Sulfurovum sp.]